MRLIGLAVVLSLSLLAPLAAEGQTVKVPRIGYLVLSPLVDPPSAERQAFLDGLRDLGYVAGRTVDIEYRSAAWNRELLPDLVAELVELKVDVISRSRTRLKPPETRRRPFPSSCRRSPMQSRTGWSRASRVRVATSPAPGELHRS